MIEIGIRKKDQVVGTVGSLFGWGKLCQCHILHINLLEGIKI